MVLKNWWVEKKEWRELFIKALWNNFEQFSSKISEETFWLYARIMDEGKKNSAVIQITNLAKSAEEFADDKLQSLAQKIDPSLVDNNISKTPAKGVEINKWNDTENNSRAIDNKINQTLEKSDKNLFTLEKALEQIPAESKLSKLYPQYNKVAESLKNIEWLDNLQAAALVYVHNGINAWETIKHPLKAQWEVRLATILTIELLTSMKGKESQLMSMSEKFASNPLSKKMSLDKTIADGAKSIKETWLVDQIGWFTSLLKWFNEAKPIAEKANTMLELLRNWSSNFNAEVMTSDQLEQLYHLCINRSFPKSEDIAAISNTLNDQQWQEAKLKPLGVSQMLISFLYDHLKELSFIDPANQEKTKELASAAQQGIDAVYDVVWQWFGAEKWSAMMDQWIESLMKFFDNPFLWALANMAGIDLSAIKQTLSGEFSPTQEEQFDNVSKGYEDSKPVNAQRVAKISWWISDRSSERFKILQEFNMKHLEEKLWQATPHIDVVKTLIGEDETLKNTYLEKTINKAWEETWKLKDGADYTQLATLYCANDAMVKSVIDSSKWMKTTDILWLLTAQWMKWDIRWVRAWTKYQEKQAKNNQSAEDKAKDQQENSKVESLLWETAIAWVNKIKWPATTLWIKEQTVKMIDLSTPTKMWVGQTMVLGYLPYSKKTSEFMNAIAKIRTQLGWTPEQEANFFVTMWLMKYSENWRNGNFNAPYKDGSSTQTAVGPWAFSRTVEWDTKEQKAYNIKNEFHNNYYLKSVHKYWLDESKIEKESAEYYAIGMLEQFESRSWAFNNTKLWAVDAMSRLNRSMTKDEMKSIFGSKVQWSKDGTTGVSMYEDFQKPLYDFVQFSE